MAENLSTNLAYLAKTCSLVSSTLILAIGPFRIRSLHRNDVKVHDSYVKHLKTVRSGSIRGFRLWKLLTSPIVAQHHSRRQPVY